MIRQPFKDKEISMKFYIGFSFLLSILPAIIVTKQVDTAIKQAVLGTYLNPVLWGFWSFIVMYAIAILFAVYSSLYAYFKLRRPGISSEVRTLVLKRHVIAIILYNLCNLYVPATGIAVVYNNAANAYSSPADNKGWKLFLKVLFFSQGYIMPLMRCTEPAFFAIIKKLTLQNLSFFKRRDECAEIDRLQEKLND
jgi:hypothetical protein